MRDFNFFEPYIKVTHKPNHKRLLGWLLIIAVIALMVSYQLMLMRQITAAELKITDLDTIITAPNTLESLAVIETKENLESDLSNTYEEIMTIDTTIQSTHALDGDLISLINAQVPEGMFLSELSLTDGRLFVRGYALYYEDVAQFAFNLRETPYFTNVLIPTVTIFEGQYQFAIMAEWLKEDADEIN